jgi:hypothetical protein
MVEQLVLNHGISPDLSLTTWLLAEYRLMATTIAVTATLSQVDNQHAGFIVNNSENNKHQKYQNQDSNRYNILCWVSLLIDGDSDGIIKSLVTSSSISSVDNGAGVDLLSGELEICPSWFVLSSVLSTLDPYPSVFEYTSSCGTNSGLYASPFRSLL